MEYCSSELLVRKSIVVLRETVMMPLVGVRMESGQRWAFLQNIDRPIDILDSQIANRRNCQKWVGFCNCVNILLYFKPYL